MTPLNLASSSVLESKKVFDVVGHEYGSIKDIIIDPSSNKILFVVVSVGGFAGTGLGGEYVAIPWQSLNVNPNTYTCVLRVNIGVVNNAPKVDINDLQDGKAETVDQLFNYYGQPEHWNKDTNMDTIESAEPRPDNHQSLKGSEKQTQNNPDEESQLNKEMDFDKLTGKSDK